MKHCERCHTPEKVPEGKKPGPPIAGDKFLDTWSDRTVGELFDTILNTMPSDGSATLTADQALDVNGAHPESQRVPRRQAPHEERRHDEERVIVK